MGLQQRFSADIAPKDPSFAQAPPALRRKLFDAAGRMILDEIAKQLGKGIGRNGRAMKVRIQPVLADGADGPVMEPHYLLSRVITLADYWARADGVTLGWHGGTGHASHRRARKKGKKATPFGTILDYHAQGLVTNAPVRDVRLCKARIANVLRAMEKLWEGMKPKAAPQPKLKPAPAADWKSKLPTLAEYEKIHGPHVPDTKADNAPVKGEPIVTKLPKGPLEGPGLIDLAALQGKPPAPPKPAPKPPPVAPKAPLAPKFVPAPPVPKPAPPPVPKPKPPAPPVQVIPPPKPKGEPIPPKPVPPKPAVKAPEPPKPAPPPKPTPEAVGDHIHRALAEMAAGSPKGKVPIAALRARAKAELGISDAEFDRALIELDREERARLAATSLAAEAWAKYHGLPVEHYHAGIAGTGDHFTHVEPLAPPKAAAAAPAPGPAPGPASYTARIAAAKLAREREEAAKAAAWTPRPQSDFREFTDTGSETEKWGQAAYKHWADTLPADEERALKIYAGDNYKWMNALLRGQPLVGDRALPYGMSEASAREYVERAAAGLRAGRTPEDLVTFRGVSDSAAMGLADLSAIEQGREMTIESFGSTTLKRRAAVDFATKYGYPKDWLMLQINQPKGSTGAYLNAGEISQYDDERELLMPPGAKLRYVGPGKPHRTPGGDTIPVAIFERIE